MGTELDPGKPWQLTCRASSEQREVHAGLPMGTLQKGNVAKANKP